MRTKGLYLLTSILLASQALAPKVYSDASEQPEQQPLDQPVIVENTPAKAPPKPSVQPLAAFTGKISKNKVRMRLQPSLDAQIIRELTREDLLIVVGETDEFYAVLPPKDTKAYIFRTFVLDNVVEGNRVNVRLEPALEAPVIAQLNSGDQVNGTVSSLNNKWLEIPTPPSTRFFVCKEYVEKIGDSTVMAKIERRRSDVNDLLNETYLMSQTELQKQFQNINLDPVIANFNKIIKQYADFPEQVARSKELLSSIQDTYLQKKIAYLEAKANGVNPDVGEVQQKRLQELDQKLQAEADRQAALHPAPAPLPSLDQQDWKKLFDQGSMTGKMATWIPVEKALYDAWAEHQSNPTPDEFYKNQLEEAVKVTGILEPYSRTVRNKPGDFVLVNQSSGLPIAYLYSTRVNLQERAGQEFTIRGLRRPNNNFAFPAYFVISVE